MSFTPKEEENFSATVKESERVRDEGGRVNSSEKHNESKDDDTSIMSDKSAVERSLQARIKTFSNWPFVDKVR